MRARADYIRHVAPARRAFIDIMFTSLAQVITAVFALR
jgi:hypothetical protein